MENINEVAKRLGVDVEFLQTQPIWVQEGRAAGPEEFTSWAKMQKGSCPDYQAMEPMSYYQGMCYLYRHFGKHCGVPFISKMVCRTGVVDPGKDKGFSSKQYRKNLQTMKRGTEGGASGRKTITYTCESCGASFESRRTRSGPKYCVICIEKLRAQGKGPLQKLKKGGS